MQRAVIFDVDGVLVDSYQPHFESWVQLFSEMGYTYTEEEFLLGFGRTSAEVLSGWSRRNGAQLTAAHIRELDDRKESLYRQIVRAHFTPIDGALKLVDALHSAGFLLAVGSSGPRENVDFVIERLDRVDAFGALVSRVDVVQGKPDPQVFLVAAERLGIAPALCAVIEDAAAGVEAANRAGMTSIALVGTASREKLYAADLVVDSLQELSPAKITALMDVA